MRKIWIALTVLITVLGGALALGSPANAGPTTQGNTGAIVSVAHQAAARVPQANSTGGACAEAAKVAWANRWNPWPSRYVIMAIGMAAACGYWIGGMWSNRAQQAWNTCWPNCPWYYAFKFW